MLLLPLPTYPAYNVITTIDGVDYELVYTYDEHRDLWRLGVNSESGDMVMGHRPLLPFVQMRPNAFASALEGAFALIAPMHTDDAYEALTGGLWIVVYGDPSEIAELTESLADLAGDADDPVVPIEVIYPPNNAILSSPVVTFTGTGPANQLLFARGESIQVDSMGSWVWTHTFNEPSPVVVFEGESGQRATVRFSIIMQPLTINPIGVDIDGTRYVFTENVHVSGSATPDSTISVNGHPVSVGGDGLWSVELALQAGQSHVITAQGSDGQVVQTSVYVWGKPDILALNPAVWMRQMEGMFIDSDATIPAGEGDPVGAWVDVDRGVAFIQEVSAQRPVIKDGRLYLEGPNPQLIVSNFSWSGPDMCAVCDVRAERGSGGWSPFLGTAGSGNFNTAPANSFFARANSIFEIIATAKGTGANDTRLQTGDLSARGERREQIAIKLEGGTLSVQDQIEKAEDNDGIAPSSTTPMLIQHSTSDFSYGDVLAFEYAPSDDDIQFLLRWLEANND